METNERRTEQAFAAETARIRSGAVVGNIATNTAIAAQAAPRGDEQNWMAWKGID